MRIPTGVPLVEDPRFDAALNWCSAWRRGREPLLEPPERQAATCLRNGAGSSPCSSEDVQRRHGRIPHGTAGPRDRRMVSLLLVPRSHGPKRATDAEHDEQGKRGASAPDAAGTRTDPHHSTPIFLGLRSSECPIPQRDAPLYPFLAQSPRPPARVMPRNRLLSAPLQRPAR